MRDRDVTFEDERYLVLLRVGFPTVAGFVRMDRSRTKTSDSTAFFDVAHGSEKARPRLPHHCRDNPATHSDHTAKLLRGKKSGGRKRTLLHGPAPASSGSQGR